MASGGQGKAKKMARKGVEAGLQSKQQDKIQDSRAWWIEVYPSEVHMDSRWSQINFVECKDQTDQCLAIRQRVPTIFLNPIA